MKAYKGFDKEMKCRGFQYESGKEYETEKAELCKTGFHACEVPLNVFDYYPPGEGSRYCEVDLEGVTDERKNDTKICGTKISVGAEIGIRGLIKAHFDYVREKVTESVAKGDSEAVAVGNEKAATAGYRGAATSRGRSRTGKNGFAIARGNGVKASGEMNAILVLAEEEEESYQIKFWKAFVIDGKKYKPGVWYTLDDYGEVVEAEGEADE